MRAEQIIAQLMTVIPAFTELFTDNVGISTITVSGSDAIVVTSAVHGLSSGKPVNIQGVSSPVTVATLTQVGGIATCTTVENHDLTYNPLESQEFRPSVTIQGANEGDYNGTFLVDSVPNRKEFTFSIEILAPGTATGSILAFDGKERGYNGYKPTITVVDTTTFSYPLDPGNLPFNDGYGAEMQVHSGFRLSGGSDIDRISLAYTEQGPDKLWGFVVLEDFNVSKDRHILNDAGDTYAAGVDFRQRLIQPFTFYVFVPTSAEITARNARDLMQDIYLPLCKSLLRVRFDEDFAEQQIFGVTTSGHGFFGYVEAYYIHRFSFENVFDLTYGDTVDPAQSVAFRDIEGKLMDKEANPDTEAAEFKVDLDEDS